MSDSESDRDVCLADARRAEQDDVFRFRNEHSSRQVRQHITSQARQVVEIEVLDRAPRFGVQLLGSIPLLRQYFPKRTDLSVHSREHLEAVAAELNERPRRILDWDTPSARLDRLLPVTSQPSRAKYRTGGADSLDGGVDLKVGFKV